MVRVEMRGEEAVIAEVGCEEVAKAEMGVKRWSEMKCGEGG